MSAQAIDANRPWLGLTSFSEETRQYFYGREDEIGELARRIQRKLLTVLFGQSGLGKTSILRAGIVPRLRAQGYCPVYVRVDYGPAAPPAAEQIKLAIMQASAETGSWTRSGAAVDGESLWEFLHHRDDVLADQQGKPMTPLLIFDQFEEIFTLAQADEDGRRRARAFIEALAELVENRPSAALEARLDEDDSAVERFDFARSDYRVLIALREDYLAQLEELKAQMPSITQNRMRLAPMNGQQALRAVSGPGGALVSDEVAEAIVRFVAGGSELAHAQVEPSLLSLICRELNDKRIAGGRDTITLDLLAGSHDTILSDFYERALADQPETVRAVVEDLLLTDSGYRENVAEERVRAAFAAAGAAPGALASLVDRRLLRIEERLDVRRVELTHDVLCGVVRASRAQRTEREAREADARLLEAQRQRERLTRRSLVRTRAVAAGCALLMVGAVGASLYAYTISQRAEQARSQAESLMTYLGDDFARELEGSGDQAVVADMDRRMLAYYDGLPQNTPGSDTERNRAIAMVSYGEALTSGDKVRLVEARRVLTNALAILEARQVNGDRSEASVVAMGRGLTALGRATSQEGDGAGAIALCQRGEAVLRPLVTAANASVMARRAYGANRSYVGTLQYTSSEYANAETSLAAAMATYASLGARDLSDLSASIGYSNAAAWRTSTQLQLGRGADAQRTGDEGHALIVKALELRPGHLRALRTRGYVSEGRAHVSEDMLQLGEAAHRYDDSIDAWREATQRDRMNMLAWTNLADAQRQLGDILFQLGKPQDAVRSLNAAVGTIRAASPTASLLQFGMLAAGRVATIQADLGNSAASAAELTDAARFLDTRSRMAAAGSFVRANVLCRFNQHAAAAALLGSDAERAKSLANESIAQMGAIKPGSAGETTRQNRCLFNAKTQLGTAQFDEGNFDAAAQTLRSAFERPDEGALADIATQRSEADAAILLSMAWSKIGRTDEAQRAIGPAMALHRRLAAANTDDALQRLELASALYAQAQANPALRAASLKEAGALVAGLPAEMQTLRSVALWRQRIAAGSSVLR
jgi:tetratricopeptide (TPR) repeat protein